MEALTDHWKFCSIFREKNPNVKIISFSRNFGQTAALSAGIDSSKGDIIIPMDGDLQNDPEDILPLLQKIEEGNDVVSGWRKGRKDPFLTRRLPSIIANRIISWIGGVHLHDYGCTLKAYRRDILKNIQALWRNASIHPDLCAMDWSSCVRNSRAPFPKGIWIIEVWDEQSLQSHFGLDGGQISPFLLSETHLCFWGDGTFDDLRSISGRALRHLSEIF